MSHPLSYEALQRPPSPDRLAALRDRLAPGAHIGAVRRLSGSARCGIHALDLTVQSDTPLRAILRRYPTSYIGEDPEVVRREWEALRLARGANVPTPEPLLLDETGELFKVPALVMSRLPGRPLARRLASAAPDATEWVEPVARALAAIHAMPFDPAAPSRIPRLDEQRMAAESWEEGAPRLHLRVDALPEGEEVLDALRRSWPAQPPARPVLLHGDFHPFNILWRGGTVSGIVDWAEARIGPPQFDLAHMRWEIALRFDLSGVDSFLDAYERASGQRVENMALWDLVRLWWMGPVLSSWVGFFQLEGRADAGIETIRARRDAYLALTMERVRSSLRY